MVRLESSVAPRILTLSGIETGKRFELLRSAKQDGNWFRWVEGHAIFTEPGAKRVQTRLKRSNILVVIWRKKRYVELRVICIYCCWETWCDSAMVEIGEVYMEKSSDPRTQPCGTPTKHGLGGEEGEKNAHGLSPIQEKTLPVSPKLQLRRLSNTEWSMMSEASLRSSEISIESAFPHQQHRKRDQVEAVEKSLYNNKVDKQTDGCWSLEIWECETENDTETGAQVL